jgi:hypothetical protein
LKEENHEEDFFNYDDNIVLPVVDQPLRCGEGHSRVQGPPAFYQNAGLLDAQL